jgi:co-chaperonin GroES (HSP10)
MGAVTAVKPDMVTIKTQNGKSEIVALEKTTKYMKDGKQAKSADLKVGDTIMINAKMDAKTKKYAAEEVTLGEKDAKAKAAPAKK